MYKVETRLLHLSRH